MGFALSMGKFGGKTAKKVGPVLLKAAPIAAAFIPGVGPLAAMGISAYTNALAKKAEGGSFKDAAIAGGIGGATSYLGGGGLGAAAKTGGTASKIGKVLSTAGKIAPLVGGLSSMAKSGGSSNSRTSGIGPTTAPTTTTRGGAMPKGGFRYSENPLNQYDQSSPNLSMALHQGRQEAIRNQPFRKGYDIKTLTGYENDDTTKPTYSYSSMPRIQSDRPDIRPRKKRNLDNSEVKEESTPTTTKLGGLAGKFARSRERVAAY